MIKDKLKNTEFYYGVNNRLYKGFQWLKETDLINIEDGKYFIDNENIYANVQTYETKESAPFEAHRKYIDIQYMINGIEKIGVTNYQNCTSVEKYNEEKDIEFLKNSSFLDTLVLNEGEFLVLYPQDAHQPSLNYDKKSLVKKVVVKVAV